MGPKEGKPLTGIVKVSPFSAVRYKVNGTRTWRSARDEKEFVKITRKELIETKSMGPHTQIEGDTTRATEWQASGRTGRVGQGNAECTQAVVARLHEHVPRVVPLVKVQNDVAAI